MKKTPVVWDGRPLDPAPVALVVIPTLPETGPNKKVQVLGAASTGAEPVLLMDGQFAAFLRAHAGAPLACHDAATLHWSLHDYFRTRGDEDALTDLWELSRESRLLDVMILDQQLRHFDGLDGGRGRSLRELAASVAEVHVPEDGEIRARVAQALADLLNPRHAETLLLVMDLAAAARRVLDRLLEKAETIMTFAEFASRPPMFQPRGLSAATQAQLAVQSSRREGEMCARYPSSRKPPAGPACAAPAGEDRCKDQPWGPLGIGIEVQAAITAQRLSSQGLHAGGADGWERVRRTAEQAFAQASSLLHKDPEARQLFKWERRAPGGRTARLVQRNPETGEVVTAGRPFVDWLRDTIPDQLRDLYHFPASPPCPAEDNPCEDPDRWGEWADGHPRFRTWRALVRASRLASLPSDSGAVRPSYTVVPVLGSRSPSLPAVRVLAGHVFQPREGCVFLVGTLEDLKPRCLAVLCRLSRYVMQGSLRIRFLDALRGSEDDQCSGAVLLDDDSTGRTIRGVAADLFALATRPDLDAAEARVAALGRVETPAQEQTRLACEAAHQQLEEEERRAERPPHRDGQTPQKGTSGMAPGGRWVAQTPARRALKAAEQAYEESCATPELREAEAALEEAQEAVQRARERFPHLREDAPAEYARWVKRTRALLETDPLGLEDTLLHRLLTDGRPEWDGVGVEELRRYRRLLAERVVNELWGFLNLDLINRLAEQLEEPTAEVVQRLFGQEPTGLRTSELLHHLTHFRRNRPVWQLISRSGLRRPGPGDKQPSDEEVATRILWWTAQTPAGRVIPPDFFVTVRREQYLAAVDEVRKAVAYALVAGGFPLVAVTDDEFLLEVPEEEVSQEYQGRLSEAARLAQRKLLGGLAAPDHWRVAHVW